MAFSILRAVFAFLPLYSGRSDIFFMFSVSCQPLRSCVYTVLAKVLGVVHSSLAEYEKLTGRQNDDEVGAAASPKSFSGYTMALLEAVAKMSVYVKEVICAYFYVFACCIW